MPVLEGGGTTQPGGTSTFRQQLNAFMQSIKDIESSGGNYMAKGPMTSIGQGLGAYQIMSSNWNAWANEAGIPGADWRDPAAQDKVARFKFSQYYEKFQSWDAVAVAWFAGPGRVDDYLQGKEMGNVKDVLGTSVPEYAEKAVAGMRKHGAEPEQASVPVTGEEFSRPPTQGAQSQVDAVLQSTDEAVEGEGERNVEVSIQQPQSQLHPRDAANVVLASVADQLAGGERLDARTLGRGGAMEPQGDDIEDPESLNPEADEVVA